MKYTYKEVEHMHADRNLVTKQLTILAIFTIVGFAFRLLPYWKEQHEGWLLCIWGANAVLPLFMVSIAKCKSLAWAYALPMIGFVVSDVIIQWILSAKNLPTSSLAGRMIIYAFFLVFAQLGLVLRYLKLSKLQTMLTGVGLTLLGSCLFFLVTNFMVWMGSTPIDNNFYYPPTWAGLMRCYAMAWPFFENQFLGDAIFSAAFFGVYLLLEQRYLVTEKNPVTAVA